MSNVRHGFEAEIIEIPLEKIVANSPLAKGVLATTKYKTIRGSIAELGVIEPLAVFRSPRRLGDYELLDGRLRLEALKELSRETAPCMVSTDDEGFTFNRHITRLSAMQRLRPLAQVGAHRSGACRKRCVQTQQYGNH